MNNSLFYSRYIEQSLYESLLDSPVVLIHGPRQCGKSTLARKIGDQSGYKYYTFDDDVLRSAAATDPVNFVATLDDKVILDEVQRVPEIFTSLKAVIDRKRVAGRFILTGSANVLLVPQLSDSLAGRMEIIRLHPISQSEISASKSNFIADLFNANFKVSSYKRLGNYLSDMIVAGGYPAALLRPTQRRRAIWYRDYINTILQRDVRELARITNLEALQRLFVLAAGQTAHLLNISDLASPFQVSRPTIRDYITLLENIFLLDELQPWHSNRLSRLIKTPKLHIGDTGVASALLGLTAESLMTDRKLFGQMLETFIYQELSRQAGWHEAPISFYHFRDKDGSEVDIVLEREGRQLCGIEVKAAATVTASDFRGLIKLRDAADENFKAGVLLYDGEFSVSFGDRLFAVPIRRLWENEP